MKKNLLRSYFDGITDRTTAGERYTTILGYFFPEFITALILSSLVSLLDARFIADLKSTSMYATVGVTSTFIHFMIKVAEGISVGTTILCGQYNGLGKTHETGQAVISSLWATCCLGALISVLLYSGAHTIYAWYQVPEKMITLGVPFLRIRALGIFFMFIFFALIGFMRGIKNTRAPMVFFVIGAVIFIFFDYCLIFGRFGFPALQLKGSALASVIQYGVMMIGALLYLFLDPENRRYSVAIFSSFNRAMALRVLSLSWPIMLDKATLALAKMWLMKMINPMGKTAIASFTVIKDMEHLAFVPAIALAQVVTFLVSNDYGRGDWLRIKVNIKKIIFLSSIMVFSILCIFSYWPEVIIAIFDHKRMFISFAARAFPLISVLVFFDLLQLILAGALRGAADVKTVMLTRLAVLGLYIIPISYFFSGITIKSDVLKFVVIYGLFYTGNGIMSLIYLWRLRGDGWKKYTKFIRKD